MEEVPEEVQKLEGDQTAQHGQILPADLIVLFLLLFFLDCNSAGIFIPTLLLLMDHVPPPLS